MNSSSYWSYTTFGSNENAPARLGSMEFSDSGPSTGVPARSNSAHDTLTAVRYQLSPSAPVVSDGVASPMSPIPSKPLISCGARDPGAVA